MQTATLIATGCLTHEYLESDRWQYNAVADWRCCDACLELDGVVFTTSQIRRSFPYAIFNPLLIYPMVHPHCRCALVILDEPEQVQIQMPKKIVVQRKGEPKVLRSEKPLTQAEIDKIKRALSFTPDWDALDIGQPTGLGESLKKRDIKRHRQGH